MEKREQPIKFKCDVREPRFHHSEMQLVVTHSMACSSLPHTLKLGTRPERPSGILSPIRWRDPKSREYKIHTHHTTTTKSNSTRHNATNAFVVYLGGIAVAHISTTGSGQGLVRDFNSNNKAHPFCRCTILAIPGQSTLLRTVFAAATFPQLLRSLMRIGFLLKQPQQQPQQRPAAAGTVVESTSTSASSKILSTFSMWDRFDMSKCSQSLEQMCPRMYSRAEADDGTTALPNWEIKMPLAGGKNTPIHATTQRRHQTCYVTSFRFSKVTGHQGDFNAVKKQADVTLSKFVSLHHSRSIVLLYEGRAMQRKIGCLFHQKNGCYKTLGTNATTVDSLFVSQNVAMVEFTNTALSFIKSHKKYWSPVFSLFVRNKNASFSQFLSGLRRIGVVLKVEQLPTFIDAKYEKSREKGHRHLLEVDSLLRAWHRK